MECYIVIYRIFVPPDPTLISSFQSFCTTQTPRTALSISLLASFIAAMDPQVEYLDEDQKYGVTKADTDMPAGDELNSSMQTETKTESRGLFGFGGKSDTSSSSESESEEGKERQRRRRAEKANRKQQGTTVEGAATGTDYSVDSIEGGNPTGGTDYSAATLEGGHPTGGTDYSGASLEGGHPTGGTDYSATNLNAAETNTTTVAEPAPEHKKHSLFGL